MTFLEFMRKFPTEEDIINYFIGIRYPDGVKCNHCGSDRVYQKKSRPKFFDCNNCGNTFSVFKGIIFEKTTTDLRKWLYAIHLFLNGKKGISGLQLKREIGVTYKTAWRMLHQIRQAMTTRNKGIYGAIVEIDETYIGGKPRKGNKRDDDDLPKPNKRGRGTRKTPVVGVISRNEKQVFAKVALPNSAGKKLSGKQLLNILNQIYKDDKKNVVITDEFRSYNILKKTNLIHLKVDHKKAFVYNSIHVNNVESFWAIVKRAIMGIYHHVSVKYLQNYIDEFCFRFNHRDINQSFDLVLEWAILS